MGYDFKILVILNIIVLCVGCCSRNESQKETLNTLPLVEFNNNDSLFAQLQCRNLDINQIVNDREMFDCYQYLLIDEPCLNDISGSKKSTQIRLSGISIDGGIEIMRCEQTKTCWIKTRKSVPPGHFGSVVYLLQDKDIKYSVRKEIISESDVTDLRDYSIFFADQEVHDNSEVVYILEYYDAGKYVKKFSSNHLLNEQVSESLSIILN